MVSTRQSSIVASSTDTYGGTAASNSDNSHQTQIETPHQTHPRKLLRSGFSAPPPPPPPAPPQLPSSFSNSNDVIVATPAIPSTSTRRQINLLDLPPEVLEKVFSFLGYKQVAHLRPVCRHIDKVCQSILNSTFQRLQHQMLHRFQAIKAKMPRRESARRNHPLACESDIIETLHMRLTLLQMTFGKHIERKHCCFFAGEILDEVNRILHYISVTAKLARPFKVTDELFDLSTMAMEFFKEHIEPTLPEIAYFGQDFMDFSFPGSSPSSKYFTMDSPPHGSKGYESPTSGNEASSIDPQPVPQSNMVLRKRIRKIKQGMKRYNNQLTFMKRDLRNCKTKISEQQKQILEYATRMDEYDKKNEETSRKFSTLLQELNKCKTELQYWRSKTPAVTPMCNNCGHISFIPTPSEDPQALTNQDIPSDAGLGLNVDNNLPLEAIEFPTEASTSKEEDFWKLYEPKKEEKQLQVPSLPDSEFKKSDGKNTHTSTNLQMKADAIPSKLDMMSASMKNSKAKDGKISSLKHTPAIGSSSTGAGKNRKRKRAEDDIDLTNKKPKRVLKVRCASKRVKT